MFAEGLTLFPGGQWQIKAGLQQQLLPGREPAKSTQFPASPSSFWAEASFFAFHL